MEENIDRTEIENIFMFQEDWPKSTTVLSTVEIHCTTGKVDTPPNNRIYRNEGEGGDHAEKRFLDVLERKIGGIRKEHRVTRIKVKLIQNYSPCSECADIFLNFIVERNREGIKFSLKIEFVNIYKDWEVANQKGLRMLKEKGVRFELLKGKEKWTTFLNRPFVMRLTNDEKAELLERAKSEARTRNEKEALTIFNHIGLGN
jgi:hypothetical protein